MGCTTSCLSPPETPPNPERIDLSHFELLKVVGKGGFGKVNAITRKFDGSLMALKRMAKHEVIRKESSIRMVWTERNIMSKLSDGVSNPFLVSLEHAFQNERELFFVMEFMQGGDLRFHLTRRGLMTEAACRFYAAEMVLALESMHRQKIIYRDFKPDNVLLDGEGHVRLSDFGLAVQLEEKYHYVMKGNAGTGGYLAPEVWAGEHYGISPDVWSFGITIYELLHGRRPYRRWNPTKNYIEKMKFHPNLSSSARSFIKGLLTVDPRKRLACGPSGWLEVKQHPFFAKIDWNVIQNKILKPPIKPDLKQANCSNQADLADQLIDKKPIDISGNYHKFFTGFDYNINFGEWLIKNEKRKEERLRKAEEAKRIKAEHRQWRKLQMEQMMKAGMPMSPLSPSSSSGSDYYHHSPPASGLPPGGSPISLAHHRELSVIGGGIGGGPHGGATGASSIGASASGGAQGSGLHLSNFPTIGADHMLMDYLHDASGHHPNHHHHHHAGAHSSRPRKIMLPNMHNTNLGYDGVTPVASSGMQGGSWHMSESHDSQTQESEMTGAGGTATNGGTGNIHPHTSLGFMLAQNHLSPAASSRSNNGGASSGGFMHTVSGSPVSSSGSQHAMPTWAHGTTAPPTCGNMQEEKTPHSHHHHHTVMHPSSQQAHSSGQHQPTTGDDHFHNSHYDHSSNSSSLVPAAVTGFSQIQLPVHETCISEEAEFALQAFKENQRRDRADAKRKIAADKALKHRTSLSQALLSVVRSKPSDPSGGGPPAGGVGPDGRPLSPAVEAKSLTEKFAEMLQKDRENIRKIIHGDSMLSAEVSPPVTGMHFRGSQPSVEMPGRIRSVAPSHNHVGSTSATNNGPGETNSCDSMKGLIPGMGVLGPGGLSGIGTPLFPYSSSSMGGGYPASSTSTSCATCATCAAGSSGAGGASSSSGSGCMNKMTHLGVPRFTQKAEETTSASASSSAAPHHHQQQAHQQASAHQSPVLGAHAPAAASPMDHYNGHLSHHRSSHHGAAPSSVHRSPSHSHQHSGSFTGGSGDFSSLHLAASGAMQTGGGGGSGGYSGGGSPGHSYLSSNNGVARQSGGGGSGRPTHVRSNTPPQQQQQQQPHAMTPTHRQSGSGSSGSSNSPRGRDSPRALTTVVAARAVAAAMASGGPATGNNSPRLHVTMAPTAPSALPTFGSSVAAGGSLPSSRPDSASGSSSTPTVRHRIHVSVKQLQPATVPMAAPATTTTTTIPSVGPLAAAVSVASSTQTSLSHHSSASPIPSLTSTPSRGDSQSHSTTLAAQTIAMLPPAALHQMTPTATTNTSAASSSLSAPILSRPNLLDQWKEVSQKIRDLRSAGHQIQPCIFLDYDGTLTPIVPVPSHAILPPAVKSLLARLLPLYPTSILTGRSLPTISGFLQGIDNGAEPVDDAAKHADGGLHIAASHGFEILLDGLDVHEKRLRSSSSAAVAADSRVKQVGAEFLPVLESFYSALRSSLESHSQLAAHLAAESLTLENNKFSLAVHYRNLPSVVGNHLLMSLDGVLDSLLARPEYATKLMRFGGKMVYEIKPRIPVDSQSAGGIGATNGWNKGCAMDFLLRHVLFPGETVSSLPIHVSSPSLADQSPRRLQLASSGVELLPIFCGDDTTDESVFQYMSSLSLCSGGAENGVVILPALSVFVQPSREPSLSRPSSSFDAFPHARSHSPPIASLAAQTNTAANFTLRSPEEVHQLLEKLIQFATQA